MTSTDRENLLQRTNALLASARRQVSALSGKKCADWKSERNLIEAQHKVLILADLKRHLEREQTVH